jgi:GAF domain-containing protein
MSETNSADPTISEIERLLTDTGTSDENLLAVLDAVLERFGCGVGTLHEADADQRVLTLRAHRGIPEPLFERVNVIPVGKGMAGLAAERREPVQVCNLQTDATGVAKPSARLTQMQGSITVPILAGDHLRGTLGVGQPNEHEYDQAETDLLMQIAGVIGKHFGKATG